MMRLLLLRFFVVSFITLRHGVSVLRRTKNVRSITPLQSVNAFLDNSR